MNDQDTTSLSQDYLCDRCGAETQLFFARRDSDTRFCFELFRRAIVLHEEDAWSCLYRSYHRLAVGWAERHPLFAAVGEDSDALVNHAFEKMWMGLSPDKFSAFNDLKALLRYLQMCIHSVITDRMRAHEKTERLEGSEEGDERLPAKTIEPGVEEQVLRESEAEELWRLLAERVRNEKERRVIFGTFVLALKPAELCEAYPGTFSDVREVYLVKDNLIARLRRDAGLRAMFEGSG